MYCNSQDTEVIIVILLLIIILHLIYIFMNPKKKNNLKSSQDINRINTFINETINTYNEIPNSSNNEISNIDNCIDKCVEQGEGDDCFTKCIEDTSTTNRTVSFGTTTTRTPTTITPTTKTPTTITPTTRTPTTITKTPTTTTPTTITPTTRTPTTITPTTTIRPVTTTTTTVDTMKNSLSNIQNNNVNTNLSDENVLELELKFTKVDIDEFDQDSVKNDIANKFNVSPNQVKIKSIKKGSVIVDFDINFTSKEELELGKDKVNSQQIDLEGKYSNFEVTKSITKSDNINKLNRYDSNNINLDGVVYGPQGRYSSDLLQERMKGVANVFAPIITIKNKNKK